MSLTLAASASERRRADATLRKQVDELAALNEASRQFLENIDTQSISEAICRLAVERFDLSAAWINLDNADDPDKPPSASYPPGRPPAAPRFNRPSGKSNKRTWPSRWNHHQTPAWLASRDCRKNRSKLWLSSHCFLEKSSPEA